MSRKTKASKPPASTRKGGLRVGLYVRVSTGEQTTAAQKMVLEETGARAGWNIVETFEDAGISGTNGRDKRPALDALLTAAARHEIDLIACFAMDRLARSTRHLLNISAELDAQGVDLYFHKQAIDTTTPAGKMFFTVLAAVGEFERDMTVERIKAGLARVKKYGTKSGNPIGRPPGIGKTAKMRRRVLRMREKGLTIRPIAEKVGLSTGAVHAILAEVQAEGGGEVRS